MVKQSELSKEVKAFLTTFFSIIGFILYLVLWNKDEYVKYYGRISLSMFIIILVGGFLSGILSHITIIGWLVAMLFDVFILVAWILTWVFALSGSKKEIVIISQLADKLRI